MNMQAPSVHYVRGRKVILHAPKSKSFPIPSSAPAVQQQSSEAELKKKTEEEKKLADAVSYLRSISDPIGRNEGLGFYVVATVVGAVFADPDRQREFYKTIEENKMRLWRNRLTQMMADQCAFFEDQSAAFSKQGNFLSSLEILRGNIKAQTEGFNVLTRETPDQPVRAVLKTINLERLLYN